MLDRRKRAGKKVPTKAKFPLEYILLQYRETFQLSWRELTETPPEIIISDLLMMNTRDKYSKPLKNQENSISGSRPRFRRAKGVSYRRR